MMMQEKRRVREELGISPGLLNKFIKMSRELNQLYETQCNGTDRKKFRTESWGAYQGYCAKVQELTAIKIARLQDEAGEVASLNGLELFHQTDPAEGWSIYLSRGKTMHEGNYKEVGEAIG